MRTRLVTRPLRYAGVTGSLLYACHLIKNDVPKVADGYLQTILVVLLIAAKTKHASLEYLFRSGS